MSRILTTNAAGESAATTLSQYDSFCRMIPVTDIEAGRHMAGRPLRLLLGRLVLAVLVGPGPGREHHRRPNFGPLDSANILGFDGLFLRGELLF